MSIIRPVLLLLVLVVGVHAGDAPPISQQIQLQPPRSENTVRALALDPATGDLSAEGQQAMAKMIQDGWRALSMTAVTVTSGPKVAVLFSRPIPPPPTTAPPAGAPGQPVAGAPPAPPRPTAAPRPAGPADEAAIAKALLASTTATDVQNTASGLRFRTLVPGTGRKPTAADTVKVRYTGCKLDGSVFDASARHGGTAEFPLSQVIKGWTEGLQLMQEGGITHFVIPPELAYGKNAPPSIGPDQTLLFEVELISVTPAH